MLVVVIFKYFLFWVLLGLERVSSNFSPSFYIYSFNLSNMSYVEFIIAFYSHIPIGVYCFIQAENKAKVATWMEIVLFCVKRLFFSRYLVFSC